MGEASPFLVSTMLLNALTAAGFTVTDLIKIFSSGMNALIDLCWDLDKETQVKIAFVIPQLLVHLGKHCAEDMAADSKKEDPLGLFDLVTKHNGRAH